MEITVHGKNNQVPKPLQRFAVEKMEHLGKYLSTITTIDVQLYEDGKPRNGSGHVAHITVSTSGPVFRTKVTSSDHRACIDIALERLERRIKEFKRKRSGKPPHSRTKAAGADRGKVTSQEELEVG